MEPIEGLFPRRMCQLRGHVTWPHWSLQWKVALGKSRQSWRMLVQFPLSVNKNGCRNRFSASNVRGLHEIIQFQVLWIFSGGSDSRHNQLHKPLGFHGSCRVKPLISANKPDLTLFYEVYFHQKQNQTHTVSNTICCCTWMLTQTDLLIVSACVHMCIVYVCMCSESTCAW